MFHSGIFPILPDYTKREKDKTIKGRFYCSWGLSWGNETVWFPVDGFNLHRKFKLLQGCQMCQSFAPCLPCSCFNVAVKQQYWESGVCSVERLSPCVMFPARKAFKYLICSLPVSQFYPISYTGVFGDDASVISFSIQHFWQTEIPQRWLEGKRNPICCFHSVRVVGWYVSVGRSVGLSTTSNTFVSGFTVLRWYCRKLRVNFTLLRFIG